MSEKIVLNDELVAALTQTDSFIRSLFFAQYLNLSFDLLDFDSEAENLRIISDTIDVARAQLHGTIRADEVSTSASKDWLTVGKKDVKRGARYMSEYDSATIFTLFAQTMQHLSTLRPVAYDHITSNSSLEVPEAVNPIQTNWAKNLTSEHMWHELRWLKNGLRYVENQPIDSVQSKLQVKTTLRVGHFFGAVHNLLTG